MAVHLRYADTNFIEEYGLITEATMVIVQDGVTGSTIGDVLVNALNHVDVPQPGAALALGVPNVRVESRTPKVVGQDGSTYTVRIDVAYRLQRPSSEAQYSLRGGATLNQITTQTDRDGNPITLGYDGDTVRAEVTVPVVANHFSREIIEATDDPDDLIAEWINHVNENIWHGGDPGEWLCSHIEYELIDRLASPKRYRFVYEFERNPDGHLYTVVWKDSEGNIPIDVVEGEGIKDIPWHPERKFSDKFA